jgi:hypothetical protein
MVKDAHVSNGHLDTIKENIFFVTNSSHFDYFQPLSCDIGVKTSTNHIAEAFKKEFQWSLRNTNGTSKG